MRWYTLCNYVCNGCLILSVIEHSKDWQTLTFCWDRSRDSQARKWRTNRNNELELHIWMFLEFCLKAFCDFESLLLNLKSLESALFL